MDSDHAQLDSAGHPRLRPARLQSLTSLRWFAALVVFVTHSFPLIEGSSLEAGFKRVGQHGAVGVSFFFILSGFVLAWTYRSGDTALAFYRRRFARIAPVYWVSSLLAFAVIAGVESDLTPSRVTRAVFSLAALQAWIPDARVYLGGNPVGWSLSVEMFFYAMFPLVILLAVRMSPRTLLISAGCLALFTSVVAPLVLAPDDPAVGFRIWALKISPIVRMSEFMIGMIMALLLRSGARIPHLRAMAWCAVTLTVGTYSAGGWVPLYLGLGALTLVPFCLLIMCFAQSDVNGEAGPLRAPWLVALGRWSFCFYLVHQLVIRVIVDELPVSGGIGVRLGYVVGALLLSVGVSAALYRLVEQPLERKLRGGARGRGGAVHPDVAMASAGT